MDITSFVLGYQKGKASGGSSGGGGSADVRYVTFMSYDGSVEYGKKAVAVGDDCADPIARGIFATPTRESTAQYDFSFVGWATTPNGAWDENALDAVTENRTVYAAYASAVRYYTITYLDSDGVTVLKTESLAYGSMPSYTPTSADYDFAGWTPALVAVTGEASYVASWKEKAQFATATWEEISAIITAGMSASSFAVGDTKSVTLTYSSGTTEEIELAIAKIRPNGSMTLAATHALNSLKPINASITANTTSSFSFSNSTIGKYLTSIYNTFPDDFKAVIRKVNYESIRLPNKYELCAATTSSETPGYDNLPLFNTAEKRIRARKSDGVAVTYWTNDKTASAGRYLFDYVTTEGAYQSTASMAAAEGITTNRGVVFLVDV